MSDSETPRQAAEEAFTKLFGEMAVLDSDQFRGRLYRCACGWEGWTVWGRAREHAALCPQAGVRLHKVER